MNNETDILFKEELLKTGIFKRVKTSQYKCKICPFCGDMKSHMYVKIDMTSDYPVVYNCFKCNTTGLMNKQFLEFYNIDDITIPKKNVYRKKIIPSKVSNEYELTVDQNDDVSSICEYIESRIGHYPTIEELQQFQYVTDPNKYCKEYLNKQNRLSSDRFWFRLTNGGLSGRYKNNSVDKLWDKCFPDNYIGIGLYTIKNMFDLHKPINVYIAEGIFDVIGLYYNHIKNNNIYISVQGRNYQAGLMHLVSMGIFGDNVNISIFKDSDVVKDIYIDKPLMSLFNKISIYQNIIGKDFGLLPDDMEIVKICDKKK